MHALSAFWNGVVRALAWTLMVLFSALVLAVLWGVISRYVPGIVPSDWTEELAIHLLVWVSLLGAALAYRQHGHLGVDYFVGKLSPDAQRLAYGLVQVIVIGFAGFALVYGGYRLVAETLATNQITAVLQWKAGYVYTAVPLSGLFIVAFALEHLLRFQPPTGPVEKDA